MTVATPEGYGAAEYGAGSYGTGAADLQLLAALAIRENVVRLTFNVAPLFTGILNPNDASNRLRYQINGVSSDARAVIATGVEVAGGGGTLLDVTVDRPFSGVPATYRVTVTQLVSALDGNLLDPTMTSFEFVGLERFIPPPSRDTAVPSRDLANRFDPFISDTPGFAVIPIDDTGDYAFDEGVISLKKRFHRRLISKKGRFAHLPDYGLGVPDLLKTLNRQRVRAELKADAEIQFTQEPEVVSALVTITTDPAKPSIMRFKASIGAPKLSSDPINTEFIFNTNPSGR